jgi:hypothetical protein
VEALQGRLKMQIRCHGEYLRTGVDALIISYKKSTTYILSPQTQSAPGSGFADREGKRLNNRDGTTLRVTG